MTDATPRSDDLTKRIEFLSRNISDWSEADACWCCATITTLKAERDEAILKKDEMRICLEWEQKRAGTAEAEVARLKANQRTARFKEVCPLVDERLPCHATSTTYPHDCYYPENCPIRSAK